jgi:quinohemoprotein amine dehydrogenase
MTLSIRNGLFVCLLLGHLVSAWGQSARDAGIPVTDALVKSKCGACHKSDDDGNMQRISWERATPEAWERALQRMALLYDVEFTLRERAHVIQYLSTHHGLAPNEAKTVIYEVERRIHEETVVPKVITDSCGRCHSIARVLSWRRSLDDWNQLFQAHDLRYDARPTPEALAFLAKMAPLHTPEWDGWTSRRRATSLDGRWLVTASVLGRVRHIGEMQFEPLDDEGSFSTTAVLRSVTDGSIETRSGRGTFYGNYAWRGLSNDAREVMTSTTDELTAEGRWFWGQYQELGFDIKIQRPTADATLLAVDPPLLKGGSRSKRLRLVGDRFPTKITPADLDLGDGITIRRIVSHSASEVVVDVDVASDSPTAKRTIALGRSALADAIAIYDHVDYIKTTPDSAMAAFGGEGFSRGYQQFEAIAYTNGPDGKRHTDDDVELGPIEASWSMKVFYESEGSSAEAVGSVSATGLFAPAEKSPNTNFDVWVIAQAGNERGRDGAPLVGKSYVVITVPVYVFNGRRYVRDLDRWVPQ